jgi:hypothetical protein
MHDPGPAGADPVEVWAVHPDSGQTVQKSGTGKPTDGLRRALAAYCASGGNTLLARTVPG